VETAAGTKLDGEVLGEGFDDLQMRTDDGKVHLLRKADGKYREVTSEVDWPEYNGDPRGNRYTAMTQITKANVSRLAPRWVFAFPAGLQCRAAQPPGRHAGGGGGLMFVTDVNQVHRARCRQRAPGVAILRPKTPKLFNDPGVNRGVAVAGDKVFLETDNAHVVAFNRLTGDLVWDSPIADPAQNYFATSAPLTAGDLVVTGVGGGEHGANGQVVAFDQATGKETWRFHVIPKRGEKGSETWKGKELDHGGGPTWFTGSYDPDLDTVYWPTGNPSEEYNGDARPGDNLYTDCILALDRKTGKLKWYYQFTPHDLWDWDATETSVLVDAPWQGQVRKLMLHADRNGFYYVFDRTDGKLLLAKQFLRHVTWASGIGPDGRPVKLPNQEPTEKGTRVCPSQDGATNWYSPSFNPADRDVLLPDQRAVQHLHLSAISPIGWPAKRTWAGRSRPRTIPSRSGSCAPSITRRARINGKSFSRAKIIPGAGRYRRPQGSSSSKRRPDRSWPPTPTTGKVLWSFQANTQNWHASPMAYQFDGKEYIAFVSGGTIVAMSLPD
jgi:alcohol dehydrogenase (cytochrome c)